MQNVTGLFPLELIKTTVESVMRHEKGVSESHSLISRSIHDKLRFVTR